MAAARGARVLRMPANAGFSRAVNAGLRQAKTEWVAIVNNDVEAKPEWLERLLRGCESAGAWFASGKLLNASRRDELEGAFDALCRGGCAWRAGHGRRDGAEWANRRPARFVPFTAALFRRQLFEQVGFLDEDFESYLEDVEFGLRCALGGFGGVYVPEAVAYHAGSATLGAWHKETVRRMARNQLLLVARHYPDKWLRRYGWPVLVAQSLWGLVALRHGAGLAWLRGKLEGLRAFRSKRRAASHPERLARILKESERELLALQEGTGFDLYWRLYFALT